MSIIDGPPPSPTATDTPSTAPSPQIVSYAEGSDVPMETVKLSPVVEFVESFYYRSKTKRMLDEQRWLVAYRNYRGLYDENVKFTTTEKSRVFIKVTKMKVLAAYAQVIDVLFAGNKFPIGIEPTPVPLSDLPDSIHLDPKEPEGPKGGVLARPELWGPFAKLLGGRGIEDKMKEGPGKTPGSATWEPIKMAAKKMEKLIFDQLEESDASTHLRAMAFELCMLGHGVVKGPFAQSIEYPKWDKDGTYKPEIKDVPKVSHVSVWNFYPDAEAKNISECDGVIERHKMSRSQLRELKKRPMFREESIDLAINAGPNYVPEYWESTITDNQIQVTNERYEVLEYWGVIDADHAALADLKIPPEAEQDDEYQVNIWICNGQILRLVFNPFTPKRIPYHATPYELNPYSFFGIGIAENMTDTQMLMNGFMRMAVDNAALSGNIVIEVDETNMVPGQSMEVYPGKVFRRQGGVPGQAIYGTNFPNVSQELLQLYDKARQLADEATNLPSYAHGGTGVAGMGRTASGMSMLMSAADKSTKAVIKNIDDYILSPLGKGMFAFNMQFNFDETIVGDLAVVAKGTESLMKNEVRSQKLLQFYQIASGNPLTAPFVKIDYVLRELATSLDLEEDKILNDPREALIQAEIMKQMSGANGAPQQGGNAPQAPTGVNDPTGSGGGMVQPGNAPAPGAKGFTGAGGGANGGNQPQPQAAPPQQPTGGF